MGGANKPGKPKSKRTPVRLRHKIEKASANKQRKARKEAKANPQWVSRLKKDPGIPNLFPYKDRILAQVEEGRRRKEEEKLRSKEAVKATKTGEQVENEVEARMENVEDYEAVDGDMDVEAMDNDDDELVDEDANPMAALLASARARAAEYANEAPGGDDDMDEDIDDADDYTSEDIDADQGAERSAGSSSSRKDGSRKAFDKVFKQVVDQADVVLYVLDARDPEGTRSREVERTVMAAASGGKRLILVLNKIDLVPPPVLRGWLAHLRRSFPTLPLRASGAAPNAHTFEHRADRQLTIAGSAATLFRALKAFAAARQLRRAVSVGVIGYPNVGKSSVINALASRLSGGGGGGGGNSGAACPVGASAGVTTSLREVKIDSKLKLLDSPGIVFPSAHDAFVSSSSSTAAASGNNSSNKPLSKQDRQARLILLNAIPPKQIADPVPAVTLLLRRLGRAPGGDLLARLADVYGLAPLLTGGGGDPTTDFLVQVARKRGRLGKGGVPNLASAAMTVLTDWRDGRIQGWTEPPPPPTAGDSAKAGEKGRSAAGGVVGDQKEIVTEWAKEFKIEGLWGDGAADDEAAGDAMQE